MDKLLNEFDNFLESKTGMILGWIWFANLLLLLAVELVRIAN